MVEIRRFESNPRTLIHLRGQQDICGNRKGVPKAITCLWGAPGVPVARERRYTAIRTQNEFWILRIQVSIGQRTGLETAKGRNTQ